MTLIAILTHVRVQMSRFVRVLLASSLVLRWVIFKSCVNLWVGRGVRGVAWV